MVKTALVELGYDKANAFVEKNKNLGFFWDGWDMYKWTPNENGFMQKNGMYRKNQWGHAMKIPMTDNGTWMVLEKYV
jgi:hypothetical protein